MSVRILHGDCRDALRDLAPASVHCVVTSPPYWGMRDYKIPPSVWGGDAQCLHDFACEEVATEIGRGNWAQGINGRGEEQPGGVDAKREPIRSIASRGFCQHCGAWSGAHGLEPTFALYIENEVAIFREVWRVLRNDGTAWLNLGDCWATGAGKVGEHPGGGAQGPRWTGGPPSRSSTLRGNGHVGGGPKMSQLAPVPVVRAGTSSLRPAMGKHEYVGERISIGPMSQPNRMPQPGLKPKDLVGVPWRVAFALQDDGWYLRQGIVWHKPNPMPESIGDRCTNAHEFIFLLVKSPRYFFDAEAIKEDSFSLDETHSSFRPNSAEIAKTGRNEFSAKHGMSARSYKPTRNKRSVWTITTVPFPEAHFATFPPKLIEPCILAGTSSRGCCVKCAAPWRREVFKPGGTTGTGWTEHEDDLHTGAYGGTECGRGFSEYSVETLGWYPTCKCDDAPELPAYPKKPNSKNETELAAWRGECKGIVHKRKEICGELAGVRTRPAVVLDPFGGAGTTGLVADRAQRDAILIELNPTYVAMAHGRLTREAPLFAEVEVEAGTSMREAAE